MIFSSEREHLVETKTLATRILSGSILAAAALTLVFLGTVWIALFVLIVSLLGLLEFYDLALKRNVRPSKVTGLIGGGIIVAMAYLGREAEMSYFLSLFVMVTLIVFLFRKDYHVSSLLDASVTVMGVIYVPWLLSHTILIRKFPDGAWLLTLLILSTCFCDIGAYFVGKGIGKHPLWPQISPKKTVEGAVGGIVTSLASTMTIGYLLKLHPLDSFLLGLCIAISGELGDLCESLLKRDVGVKDTGDIIAGHGGVLDRFDSFFFASFAAYLYLKHVILGGIVP